MKEYLKHFINGIIILAIILVLNVIASYYFLQWDLTEDKRFSITPATEKMLKNIEDPIYVRVLLDGDLPSGYQRLQDETTNLLRKFGSLNNNIVFDYDDPLDGENLDEVRARQEELKKDGILPARIKYVENKKLNQQYVYPHALVNYGSRFVAVNLLENSQGQNFEQNINNSISLLEYKFADAIQKLTAKRRANILFTSGNGELKEVQTVSLESKLKKYYNTARVNLDSTFQLSDQIDLLIVAKPRYPIDDKKQFVIDQYIMNGGKVIWLVDNLSVNVDSINANGVFVPQKTPLGLTDMFFKYGVRYKDNLVLDYESTRIAQTVAVEGGKAQVELFKWPYYPLIGSRNDHPINKGVDRIHMSFPSTIEEVGDNVDIDYIPLLKSSQYTRYQLLPMRLTFEILKEPLLPEKFNKTPQDVAVLVEGQFESLFKNRLEKSMEDGLDQLGMEFKEKSEATAQIFISDGDLIKNLVRPNSQEVSPVGYHPYEQMVFGGNEQFFLNAVEYLISDAGILAARNKEVKLRLMDRVKAETEKGKWRFINVVLPVICLLIFGLVYRYFRKRKYTK